MSAKEEHARNVDMHKMRRQYTELTRQNAVLETECASLKIATKDAFDKCSTLRETMTKQYTEKMNELKTNFENENKRLNEQAQKDASFQRAQHLESFNEIKRQLESIYNAKINEQNAAHEALMQQLKTDRAEMEEHMAQLAQDRHQVNAELEEARERIKREEQEHIIRLVMELDSDREKMKCQLIEDRKELVEQLEKEDIDKRQRNDNEIMEMKKQAEFEINERMIEVEAEFQRANDAWDNARKKEEELSAWRRDLDDHFKKKEEEHQQRLCNDMKLIKDERSLMQTQFEEEREKMKRENDERLAFNLNERRAAFDAAMRKLNDDRDALMETDLRREKEHMQLMKHVKLDRAADIKTNADALAQTKHELTTKYNAEMQQLNEERQKINQQLSDETECNKRDNLEREKEHTQFMAQVKLELETDIKTNAAALAQTKHELATKYNAEMQQLNEERQKINQQLSDETECNKRDNLEREKEHTQFMAQVKLELETDIKTNAAALAQTKHELATKYNAEMQQLNEERHKNNQRLSDETERSKRDNLERKKEHTQFMTQVKLALETDIKANAAALAQTKHELTTKYNAEMQQLNEERHKIKQRLSDEMERSKRDNLEREKLNAMQHQLEKERVHLFEQAKNDAEIQRKLTTNAIAQANLEYESRFNARVKEHEAEVNASLRNKMQELMDDHRQEKTKLIEKMQKNNELQCKFNADALAENKRVQEAQFIAVANERRIAFDAAIRKLNDDRDALMETDLRREKEHNQLMKQVKLDRAADIKANADALAQTKHELETKCNAEMQKQLNALAQTKHELVSKHNAEMQQLTAETERIKRDNSEREKEHMRFIAGQQVKFQNLKSQLEEERDKLLAESKINETKLQNSIKMYNDKCATTEVETIKMRELQMELTQKCGQKDNELHAMIEVEKLKQDDQQRVQTRNKLSKHLHDAVVENATHMQLISSINFKDKRVAIYSHYSSSNEVESYNLLTIEGIQHYFDCIIVLTNCPNKWNMQSPNYNKIYLLNYNMKSDFRNYGVFIMQTELSLRNAACICLVNDSFVVVDVNAFGRTIKRIFNDELASYDFIGLTSSYENVFHIQSYFIHFNASTLNHVMDYFKTQGLPDNHEGAISKYELGISMHLINSGFSQFSFVSNNEMKHPFNTTCIKWSEVLNETGIIKRQHFLKKYANKSMSNIEIFNVADKYSYNVHFIHFLKYNHVNFATNS